MRAFRQADHDVPDDGARLDAMRSWLANGIHKFAVDPRRQRGRHGHARQMLAEDLGSGQVSSGRWQSLASALHRHTVRAGMAELSEEEQRVITLAYLEGRTNREIAGMLGVSVSTVRRRLWVALKHLEAYINRSGTWVSTVLLLGVAYVFDRTAKIGRWANVDFTHRLVSTVAVGAVTVTAVGLTAFIPGSAGPGRPSTTERAPSIAAGSIGGGQVAPAELSNLGPAQTASILTPVKPIRPLPVGASDPETSSDPNNGCGGNPTSAPPPVPVGQHSYGSPVSHPSAGGC